MAEKAHILLIEDDESLREVMSFNLQEAGHIVDVADNGESGVNAYDPDVHDVVITDLRMPKMDGMEVLERLRAADKSATVLVVTAFGSTDRAVEAMRRGAFHYVEKPVNTKALIAMIARAAEHRRLKRENAQLKGGEKHSIVAASPAMNEVLRVVDKVAASDATVLIQGESGTGKELVARAIHERSERRDAAFVAVNCAAIPSELLESALFGHEKGAFTGATQASKGKFAAADGGTLFLDEVAEMTSELQSKLLRVLQEGEIDVVGSNQPLPVDVRVLAATHQDLRARVDAGEFREDLFYRLNVVPITVPPLRERREDIPVLLRFFIRKHGDDVDVERDLDELLLDYDWPGNVRELENLVQRMLLLRDGDTLTVDDVPGDIRSETGRDSSAAPGSLPFSLPEDELDLVELEKSIIAAALKKNEGNQSATARYLNIPRHVLLYRLEKYGLTNSE